MENLERDLALLAEDRETLERLSQPRLSDFLMPPEREVLARAIARIDLTRQELIARSTFAIAGAGFDVIFGAETTSVEKLTDLVETAIVAMSTPRPDFHLDPSALEPGPRLEHEAMCEAYASAQAAFGDACTPERIMALGILGIEVLGALGKASLAEVPLKAPKAVLP